MLLRRIWHAVQFL